MKTPQNNPQEFEYTYSAARQEQIRRIRDKYLPPQETTLEHLIRLDKSVARKGTVLSLLLGIGGTLLLGIGMSCTMVWQSLFALGVAVGLAGILAIAAAYPLYAHVTRKERQRLAPQILQLVRDLEQNG